MTEMTVELLAVIGGGSARHWARRLVGPGVRWGSLRRTRPFSDNYGFERGTPIDRVYIGNFFERWAADVRGRVLEVRDPHYTHTYGGGRVTAVDIVDVDSSNQDATLVADLGEPGSLPAGRFDCVIVTQTLQYVARPAAALENVWAALAPGGVALITVPCLARIDPDFDCDLWRVTHRGLEELLRHAGAWDELEVSSYGNVLAGVAFLMGLAGEELQEGELAETDEDFPVVACARARRPG